MRKRISTIVLITVALATCVPYSTVSVPEWQLHLVDRDGNTVANVPVEQEWSHFTILGNTFDTRMADSNGNVVFPARRLFCPFLLRGVFRFADNFSYYIMPHGSRVGAYARITTEAGTFYSLEYRETAPVLKHELVVRQISDWNPSAK